MNNANFHHYKHVILISLDSLRGDCVTAGYHDFPDSILGQGKFKTDRLDFLAERGTYFTNCLSAAPYTSASHAAYFTGCWPRHNGVYEFFNRKISCPTLFERAQRKKIRTIFQTDFPIILGDSLGFIRGVDKYYIESEQAAFAELLKKQNENTLSFFHFGGIHYPYGFHKLKFAPVDFPKKVDQLEKKFNIAVAGCQSDMLDESFRNSRDKSLLLRYKNIVDTLWGRKEYDELHRLYLEGIDYFLQHRFNPFIKMMIDFVDATDSLLILFADHGEQWAADSRGHSNAINDSVLRVPLIFYDGGQTKNSVVSKLVRTIDVAPTICHYSEISGGNFDGLPIDLSDPTGSIGSREAFAQVWRVGDRQKIYQHQQLILQGKKMIRPLATRLEKEAVYGDKFVLSRVYDGSGRLSKETFSANTGRQLIEARKNHGALKQLRSKIIKYNQAKYRRAKRLDIIGQSIANDLQALGYRV